MVIDDDDSNVPSVQNVLCTFCKNSHPANRVCPICIPTPTKPKVEALVLVTAVPSAPNGNKYMREIKPGIWVDVYDVISAFEVTDGGMQHALKKIMACGKRGHKDEAEDRKDILDSIIRSNDIFNIKTGE